MPALVITKNYADNTILTQLQLNQAMDSISDWANNIKLDDENIQSGSITQGLLAANSVGTAQVQSLSIDLGKLAAAVSERLVPSGAVIPFAGDVIPTGYLYCDGTQVSRTVYAVLFGAIGIKHGEGDAVSTFHLPDYRGRFLRGFDNGAARDPDAGSRTAMNIGGVTGDAVGSLEAESYLGHTHTASQGSHSHTVNVPVKGHTIAGAFIAPNNSGSSLVRMATYNAPDTAYVDTTSASAPAITVSTDGGLETRPVNANVRYLIKY